MAKQKENSSEVSHWLILILLALAQFMVVLDLSIVNVALPHMQSAFHLSLSNLQWIVTAYALTFGGLLLLGGRTADLFGRRRIFLTGVSLFTIASLGTGLAQSGVMLIIFRALQGMSAAFMSPAALSIVLVTYREGHERNVALSVWGAVASGGAAAGVLFGGIITQYLTWRWNFFVNVPVGIFVVIASLKVLGHHKTDVGHNNLDLPGAISVTTGLMVLVYALTKAPSYGWLNHRTLIFFAISVALLVFFVINEQRAKHPLMPLRIFKIRNLSGANASMTLLAAAMMSVFFFTTLYIQEILGFSPVKTGLSFLIIPATIVVVATNVPRVIKKIGYKPILMVAPLVVASGLFYLSHIPVHGHYWANLAPGLILMGLGMGATFVSITIAATSGVAHHDSGLASGLLNTTQQIGGSIGLAVLTGVAASGTSSFIHGLHHAPSKYNIAQATVHGYHNGYLIASFFGVAASIVATIVIKSQKAKTDPSHAEKAVLAH
ncbi:MAG TPA: MFS transporter [Candidatus Saccharimonadales bacterium]|nr:MFS transporter [Candidatus Saccharimonadales bacterium]